MRRKKFGELWSTNKKVKGVNGILPNLTQVHFLQETTLSNKNAQLSLTNPRDAKPCQKFLQLEVITSSSQVGNPVFSN